MMNIICDIFTFVIGVQAGIILLIVVLYIINWICKDDEEKERIPFLCKLGLWHTWEKWKSYSDLEYGHAQTKECTRCWMIKRRAVEIE